MFSAFAKRQDGAVRGNDDGRDAVSVIAILARGEDIGQDGSSRSARDMEATNCPQDDTTPGQEVEQIARNQLKPWPEPGPFSRSALALSPPGLF